MTQQKAEAMEHGELIARLEAASEGSRELDREMMLLVGGAREVDHCTFYGPDERVWYFGEYERETDLPPLPYLTSSLDAIVALIERKLPEQFAGLQANRHPDRPADWSAWLEDGMEQHEATAETPALALCIALLRALQHQGEAERG